MPGVPNGTTVPAEVETHGEHHGPELQRTGRCVCGFYQQDKSSVRVCPLLIYIK